MKAFPRIDSRDRGTILEYIQKVAPYYVPEWKPSSEQPDVGWAFASVFAQMMEETIYRLNQVPYKNYVYFLNMLGVEPLPSIPASGFVTIHVTPGAEEGVFIPRGTQLYASADNEEGRVIFEVSDDLYALDNTFTDIYCMSGRKDTMVRLKDKETHAPMHLFGFQHYPNLQSHELYLSHEDVLNIKKNAGIELNFFNTHAKHLENQIAEKLADADIVRWEHASENGWNCIDHVEHTGNKIVLQLNHSIPNVKFQGIDGKWLRCCVKDIQKFQRGTVTDIRIAAKGKEIIPDLLFNNDIQLHTDDCLPFGERFSIYDEFYIASEEVFTKRGALIHLDFDMKHERFPIDIMDLESQIDWKLIMKESELGERKKYDVTIEHVVWEYFNGTGWSRLFLHEEYEKIFAFGDRHKIRISFVCPEDMSLTYVGARDNYWIRGRIIKINNAYKVNGDYLSPRIENISMEYTFRGDPRALQKIMIRNNMETKNLHGFDGEEVLLFYGCDSLEPAVYMGLEKRIEKGPVKVYFAIDECKNENPPSLQWEYYGKINGKNQWVKLKNMDETNHMIHSGLVTFVLDHPLEKKTLFGKERYWIRLVNLDGTYHNMEDNHLLPVIRSIHFNTVKIFQKETFEDEYFWMEPQQQNKICELIGKNITHAQVWVNEFGHLTLEQMTEMQEKRYVRIERDWEGNMSGFWVRWEPIRDLMEAKSQERCYWLEAQEGKIHFGDGIHGKIPLAQENESIQVSYSIGNGIEGNVSPGKVNSFVQSIPFIQRVENVEPILGGEDRETTEGTIQRGLQVIQHQNRAVTNLDYEQLAKEASLDIIKAKCVSHMNQNGEKEPGAITVVVLAKEYDRTYDYRAAIKKRVKKYLIERCSNMVAISGKLVVIEPKYIEICTNVTVYVESYNDYQRVMQQIEKCMDAYLDPIRGNYDGTGWEIGAIPNRERIYNMIKTVDHILRIQQLNITAFERVPKGKKEIDFESIFHHPYVIPVSGKHDISIIVQD